MSAQTQAAPATVGPPTDITKDLRRRFSQILKQEVHVLDKRGDVEKLRAKHAERTNSERTLLKLSAWKKLYGIQKGIDLKNRPSDQLFDVRIYSKIDYDTWERTEMRGWYGQYAVPMPRESWDPVQARYSTVAPPRGPGTLAKAATAHVFAAPSARPPPSAPPPHFLDFEANLTEQRASAAQYLTAARNFPPPDAQGVSLGVHRVPGYRAQPWKDRPLG
jgi:hypothetical protein